MVLVTPCIGPEQEIPITLEGRQMLFVSGVPDFHAENLRLESFLTSLWASRL